MDPHQKDRRRTVAIKSGASDQAAGRFLMEPRKEAVFDEVFPKSDASYSQMNFQLRATSTI
jgi:hypothetical protein